MKKIIQKLGCVIIPRFDAEKTSQLKNWDLWGPLLFTLILCV